jgi:1,4-dihydroxy-2-naphthoyl-CoA synthase
VDEDKVANRPGADTDCDPQAQTNVRVERRGCVAVVTMDRPRVRNAVDRFTAAKLATAIRDFDTDDPARVGADRLRKCATHSCHTAEKDRGDSSFSGASVTSAVA